MLMPLQGAAAGRRAGCWLLEWRACIGAGLLVAAGCRCRVNLQQVAAARAVCALEAAYYSAARCCSDEGVHVFAFANYEGQIAHFQEALCLGHRTMGMKTMTMRPRAHIIALPMPMQFTAHPQSCRSQDLGSLLLVRILPDAWKLKNFPEPVALGGNVLLVLVLQSCRRGLIIFIHLWKFLGKAVQQLFIRLGDAALQHLRCRRRSTLPPSLCCIMQSR